MECLPDGHLADVESAGNFTFRTKSLPLAQLVLRDQLPDMIHNLRVVGHETMAVDCQTKSFDRDRAGLCSELCQGEPPIAS